MSFERLFEALILKLKMNPLLRKKVNVELAELSKTVHGSILDPVREVLEKNKVVMLQEDGTRWSGILTGREGRTNIAIGNLDIKKERPSGGFIYTPYENSVLVLSWYKLESGRYEITAYLS